MEETSVVNFSSSQKEEASFRELPHNIEAEQALLGALLINNDALDRVSDFLKPEHFFEPLHQKIYDVVSHLIKNGKLANPVTIKPFIPAEEKIGDITVFNYVIRLAKEAVTIINAEDYGRVIYDLFIRRSLINIGNQVVNTAFDAPLELTPSQQIETVENQLFELAEKGKYGGGFENFNEAIKKAIDMATAAKKRSSHLSGIATHIKTLDEKMGGLQPSDLIILAGRPGMGKTSLATNIAFNIANACNHDANTQENEGGIVGFFSLEMSSEQLATRIISEQTEVSSSDIRRGSILDEQFSKIIRAMNQLQKAPLYIDQTGGISIAQLAARARRLKRQHGLDVLIIDYIQLMTSNSKRSSENRVQEITEITTGLKALAKELNIPIIALSQLSRQVENRTDKRPQLSDLRESGSIEQDADIVLFVYREEYYLKNGEPKIGTLEYERWQETMDKAFGKAEVIIAKQRHGPTGTVHLAFQSDFTRFSDLADSNYLPEQYG
ncbi:replicative DNA helicase [Bartonella henselae]|uniref:Replicative DNA helicase n=1 Tax=Bartonella henselae (strain ATCC 49882 / DSM 28221 / CCUG 30454 / Houston 1) TaxID=283166 RepID=A0A0H3LW76_BARHE|nr:replicative DNA helicase [Bartonella henselae]ATP12134.1 replicative DNA helicase [Bartonella henselae]ETS07922.1 replicative DNA helicase [Bartonella henselae JK 42]ETS09912.1 replicative DNA helicase [Bartonella henselae JK 50]ETS10422.1 replicative DNA helicase [Bartonella henselae JK 51]ETS12338.1 replicative DNA helicase [Bartonella henselae JK 41]